MGRAGLRGKLVEAFKFAVYLSIPVGVTIASIQPENLEWIIRNRQYVVYPKENKRPPTGDEFYEHMRTMKENKSK